MFVGYQVGSDSATWSQGALDGQQTRADQPDTCRRQRQLSGRSALVDRDAPGSALAVAPGEPGARWGGDARQTALAERPDREHAELQARQMTKAGQLAVTRLGALHTWMITSRFQA